MLGQQPYNKLPFIDSTTNNLLSAYREPGIFLSSGDSQINQIEITGSYIVAERDKQQTRDPQIRQTTWWFRR